MKAINYYIVRSRLKGGIEITPEYNFDTFKSLEECLSFANKDDSKIYEIFVLLASKMEIEKVKVIE